MYFHPLLEVRKPQIKVLADSVSGEGPLELAQSSVSHHMAKGETERGGGRKRVISSHDVTNPSTHCFCLESESEVAQSCPTHDPMDCSLPRSSVHGVLQARTVEWAAISFSSSQPRDQS